MTKTDFLAKLEAICPDAAIVTHDVGGTKVTYVYAPEIRERFRDMTHIQRVKVSSFVLAGESVLKDKAGQLLQQWEESKHSMKDFKYKGTV